MQTAEVVQHGPQDLPLAELVWQLAAGSTVVLAPGSYRGPVALPVDIEIRAAGGMGSVTIETTTGGTLSVEGAERVKLVNLMLRGPTRSMGAVLRIYNFAEVDLQGCVFTGGRGQGEIPGDPRARIN